MKRRSVKIPRPPGADASITFVVGFIIVGLVATGCYVFAGVNRASINDIDADIRDFPMRFKALEDKDMIIMQQVTAATVEYNDTQVQSNTQRIGVVEGELSTTATLVTMNAQHIQSLEMKEMMASNNIEQLQTTQSTLGTRVTQLEGQQSSTSNDVQQLQNTVTQLETEQSSTSTSVQQLQSGQTTLQNRATQLEAKDIDLQVQIDGIVVTTQILNASDFNASAVLFDTLARVMILEPRVEVLQNDTLQNAIDIDNLQAFQSSTTSTLSALQADVLSHGMSITTLQGDVTALQQSVTTIEANLTSAKQDIVQLEAGQTSNTNSIAQLQTDLNSNTLRIDSLEVNQTTISASVDSNSQNIALLQPRVDSLEAADVTLFAKDSSLQMQIDALYQTTQLLNTSDISANQTILELLTKVMMLEPELEQVQNETTSNTARIVALEAQDVVHDTRLDNVEAQQTTNTNNIATLQSDVSQLQVDQTATANAVTTNTNSITQLEMDVNSINTTVTSNVNRIEALEGAASSGGVSSFLLTAPNAGGPISPNGLGEIELTTTNTQVNGVVRINGHSSNALDLSIDFPELASSHLLAGTGISITASDPINIANTGVTSVDRSTATVKDTTLANNNLLQVDGAPTGAIDLGIYARQSVDESTTNTAFVCQGFPTAAVATTPFYWFQIQGWVFLNVPAIDLGTYTVSTGTTLALSGSDPCDIMSPMPNLPVPTISTNVATSISCADREHPVRVHITAGVGYIFVRHDPPNGGTSNNCMFNGFTVVYKA